MPRRPGSDPQIGARIRTRRQLRGWSIRFAADRAGLAHTTWSRIERGIISADNRYTLADIARALDCSVLDLAGNPAAPDTRDEALLAYAIDAIHTALLDADIAEAPLCVPRPWPELIREAELVHHLRMRCDFLGAARRLPDLVRELHAATHGPHRGEALHRFSITAHDAQAVANTTGYKRDCWLSAMRCQQAAELLDDPIMLALGGFATSVAAASAGAYARSVTRADRAADALSAHLDVDGALPMLGMLHMSYAMSARGDHRESDSGHRLAEASSLAARTGETMTLDMGFGPTNLAIWQITIETDGGDPGRAVEISSKTTPAALPMPSRQATFHSDVARA
ncbi:MAG TPA: helix-turn-helix domain-containing protein, partial [Mycobacterium sp.]|nr:helix-turn-helix domain-containing protein [Mycobacterium sp.]